MQRIGNSLNKPQQKQTHSNSNVDEDSSILGYGTVVYIHRWCLYRFDHHQGGCIHFLQNDNYIYQSSRCHIPDNLSHQHRWRNITSNNNWSGRTSDFIHFCPHTFCNSTRKIRHDVSLWSFWLTYISTTKIISSSDDVLPNIIRNTTSHLFLTRVMKRIHRLISLTPTLTLRHFIPNQFTTIFDHRLITSAGWTLRANVILYRHKQRLRTLTGSGTSTLLVVTDRTM